MRRAVWAAALLAAPGGSVASAGLDTLTLVQARSMSVPALARRVLGMAGGPMREAHAHAGWLAASALTGVEFASAPDASAADDICRASHVVVGFVTDNPAVVAPTSRAVSVQQSDWWAFLPAGSAARTFDQRRASCARAGPVIRAGTPHPRFFPVQVGVEGAMDHALLVLLDATVKALAAPAALNNVPVACGPDVGAPCSLVASLAGVDARRPRLVSFRGCKRDPTLLCIELLYPDEPEEELHGRDLIVVIEVTRAAVTAEQFRPLRISLDRIDWYV